MKRGLILILALCYWANVAAQSMKQHDNLASFSLGFGWIHKPNIDRSFFFPSPSAIIERAVLDVSHIGVLSVGAHFGAHYGFHRSQWVQQSYREDFINVYFLPRAAFYFQELFQEYDFPETIDLFAFLELGFRASAHNISPELPLPRNHNGFKFAYRIGVGARYYFNDQLAIFATVGYGLSFANIGISLKY